MTPEAQRWLLNMTGFIATCTDEDMYDFCAEMARQFHKKINPTPDEVRFINEEIVDIGIEDLLVDPDDQTEGDLGLLAALVYEHREMAKEESGDDN